MLSIVKSLLLLLFFCALPLLGNAQSFEWESEPEIGICDVDETKIVENASFEYIMIGDKNCKQRVYKFNQYGKIQWELNHGFPFGGFNDLMTFDNSKTYYLMGVANSFPTTVNFFQINENGTFLLKKQTVTRSYLTQTFCNKLYKNTIVTGGYGFTPEPQVNPLLEFRSFNGDTMGKFEYKGEWYSKVKKICLINNDSAFLLFCAYNGYGLITTILINTRGEILKTTFLGNGNEKYQSDYCDLVEKDSTFYMLVNTIYWGNSSKNGDYIYRFNILGDSIGMKRIEGEGRFTSIAKTLDNGLVLAGETLLKLDSNLQVEWEKPFKEGVQIQSLGASETGGYFGSGRRYDKDVGKFRTYVFKTNIQGNIEANNNYPNIEIYPNPFSDKINLELTFGEQYFVTIYDLQGKKYLDFDFIGSTYLNLGQVPSGIYILNLQDKSHNTLTNKKVIKLEEF